ncbi:MAG: PSD1 and planctomycete cytochrome C domain-containing protein [Phycisphaeraceae bacterium]|nr:PSD1 and planctomycete cytochrome C domain-containing protein [Phycisphaeraceae bacterium]
MLFSALCLLGGVLLLWMTQQPTDQQTAPDDSHANTRVVTVAAASESGEQEKVDFAREVLPILSNNCYLCHGPDQDSKEAKLAGFRLDIREEAVEDEMIIPGDPDASPVIDVLTTKKASRRMPPLDSGKPQLKPEQVELLKRWIAEGAEYTDHWAFVKPVKPEVPELPKGADPNWASNNIDRFIFAKLHENGLEPNDPADRSRLIRRVYLDLIGLPPTPEQAKAFISDSSPDAYERVVDELLASPQFGEHWARQWLDKARYADSKGFSEDRPRTMWRYRDYVINAYNRDLPFDLFTIDQIAGDLLPNPTLDQLIATGFHRNTMTNDEGGTDNEEFRAAAVIDRVNTTAEVWLGLTVACAQCHTHKYDPIFHDEYFAFYAFFNQSEDADRKNDAPFIKAPTVEQQAQAAKLKQGVDEARKALNDAGQKPFVAPKDPKAKDAPKPTPEQAKLIEAEKQYNSANNRVPTALVMKDLPADQQRETYLFKGGSFLAPDKEGGIIEPDTPAVFNPFPEGAPRNRLGLARWLVHEDNPLTARVQANRIWEQIWGIGLVETTEDFGFQGSYPSNKPLLDYLAVTYQQDLKWSTKSFIKAIVMTSAYRQNSLHVAEKLEADPFNRLVWRGPRIRLSAEQIRDQALAIAGILKTDRVGGPSVTPYLPDGVLAQAFNGYRQTESKGADLYRRGVYTFWRRGSHYASFAAFDAPSRDICTAKRSRTNTPLQAFVTLNDTAFFEAAQMLGRRILAEGGDQLDGRLRHGMWIALQREPNAVELEALRKVYTQSLADYRENPEAAKDTAVGPSPELPESMDAAEAAAMTLVGNVLLNLDELINKP